MTWVAVAIGGSALVGGLSSYLGAKQSANAARDAAGMAQGQYQQTRSDLMPWQQAGNVSLQQLQTGLGQAQSPSADWNDYLRRYPDVAASATYGNDPASHYEKYGQKEGRTVSMAQPQGATGGVTPGMFTHQFGLQDFQESPAYQFNLQQGQMALDKGANARGNLYAPQTLQDLSKFSQGLASNEWNNAYSQYNNNIGNIWNRLYGMSQGGQAAANQTGTAGQGAAQTAGAATMAAGNAQAAGTMGINTSLQNLGNNAMFYQYLQNQQQPAYSSGGSAPYSNRM